MSDRKFDWRPNHDERSRNFRAVAPVSVYPDRGVTHRLRWPVLDQGREGACVGHGVINGVGDTRHDLDLPAPQTTAFGMYYGSRYIDETPGEDYDGTSVLAGCKLAVSLGFASGYTWAFGAVEAAHALLTGPVVIGINWRSDMYSTMPSGLVVANGTVVGGHCICLIGFMPHHGMPGLPPGPMFRWRNSWGGSYGLHGDGYVPAQTLAALLADQGEAAVLTPVGAS